MRKILGLMFAGWLIAAPVSAQPSLEQALVEARKAYPERTTADQTGELLNSVAAAHLGWGLHKRPANVESCPQPITQFRISCDLLVFAPTQGVFDVLIDGGGLSIPQWNFKGTINTMDNFVAAVLTVPVPQPTPTPTPTPTPPPVVDLTPVLVLLNTLRLDIDILEVQQQLTYDLLRRHDEEPMWLTKVLSNRYVQVIGAALAARFALPQ
jgi:hypothetical protein